VCYLPGWSASACCHVLAFIMLAYWWVVPGGQTRCYPPVQLTGWLLLPCQLDVRGGRCAVAGGAGWLPWQLAHTLAMAGSNPAVPRQRLQGGVKVIDSCQCQACRHGDVSNECQALLHDCVGNSSLLPVCRPALAPTAQFVSHCPVTCQHRMVLHVLWILVLSTCST
jgi:hypothetical protein